MIVGVDIGGTKTLLAVFAENGKLLKEVRFETARDYKTFLTDVKVHATTLETAKAKIACAAIPGRIDRKQGMVLSLGNLPWKDRYIQHDLAKQLGVKSVYIENDSKLAGLAEVHALKEPPRRAFYITISTGIGGTLLIDKKIANQVIDGEIGMVPFPYEGKLRKWESFASGKAFVAKYGSRAEDTNDSKIWKEFSYNIGLGISMICCVYQVETIIFGGGLGQHLAKFEHYLTPFISSHLHATITKPKQLVKAAYGDESVIYGCYRYAKDQLA